MRGKISRLPGEILQAHEVDIFEKMRSNNELQEVSRGHSTRGKKTEEGPNNR